MTISSPDTKSSSPTHVDEVSPAEMAVGVVIGRTAESFDFLIYAFASVIVFPRTFFPFVDTLTGTLYSLAIFSLAFVARPLGTALFTRIDRRYGRGTKLGAALMLLGSSTVAIAFLPGYAQIGGASIWLLALCRIGQGFALAGSWDGLSSLLAVHAPPHRRGFYAMIPQLGAPLGTLVASGLFAYIIANLSTADFLEWGWRYPFFVAFAINVVALFARLRIVVTPEYVRLFATRELQPSSIRATIRCNARTIAIGAFVPLASFALFHVVTVFPLAWVMLVSPGSASQLLVAQAVGSALGVATSVASGWLADRIGRLRLLAIGAALIAVFSAFAPPLLNAGRLGQLAFVLVGCALLGLSFGQASGAVAANFSIRHRYTGSALTSDLAWLFGAGFAPWVALALSTRFGLAFGGAFLLSGAVGTLLALFLNRHVAGVR